MGAQIVASATMTCSLGTKGGRLSLLPTPSLVTAGGQQAATIHDIATGVNVASFGMCSSPANPQVAAATSAAGGTLTPQPCVPVIAGPWAPGSATVLVNGKPALNAGSTCTCNWGGSVTVSAPGQAGVQTA